MSSSKTQAVDLKDAYVKGLIDSKLLGATGSEVGQQASVHYDLNNNLMHRTNDNDPTVFVTNGYDEYPNRPTTRSVDSMNPAYDENPVMESLEVGPVPGARDSQPLGNYFQDEAIDAWHRSQDPSNRTWKEPRFTTPGRPVN